MARKIVLFVSLAIILVLVGYAIFATSRDIAAISGRQIGSVLVSPISAQPHKVTAVGDGEHFWMTPTGGKGVYVLHRDGTIANTRKPFLPDVEVRSLIPAGDHRHAFVTPTWKRGRASGIVGLYRVGLKDSETVVQSLLPRGHLVVSINVGKKGAWLSTLRFNERDEPNRVDDKIFETNSVFYASGRNLKVAGPWQGNISRVGFDTAVLKGDVLINVRESFPGKGDSPLAINLWDPDRGHATLSISLPPRQTSGRTYTQIVPTPDGQSVWVMPHLHNGIARLDVDAMLRASREKQPYQPTVMFKGEDLRVQVAPDGTAWLIHEEPLLAALDHEDPVQSEIHIMTPAPENRHQTLPFKTPLIEELVPLDGKTALIQLRASPRSLIQLINISGTFKDVAEGHVLADPGSRFRWSAQVIGAGSGVKLVRTEEALLVVDTQKETLTNLSGSTAHNGSSVTKDQDRLWVAVSDADSAFRGITLWKRDAPSMPEYGGHRLFKLQPIIPDIVPLGDGKVAAATAVGLGTYLIDTERRSLPIRLTLGNAVIDLNAENKVAKGSIAFDPQAKLVDGSIIVDQQRIKLAGGTKAQVELISREGERATFETTEIGDSRRDHPLLGSPAKWKRSPFGQPVTLRISVEDPLGSRTAWEWKQVLLVQPVPLLARPWFKSVVAFCAILFTVGIFSALHGALQRWMPIAVYIIGIIGGSTAVAAGAKELLDGGVLLGLLAGSFLIAAVAAYTSPRVFREIERVEPFRFISPWLLSIGQLRRRAYASYVRRLSADLASARQEAKGERYYPVPIREVEARDAHIAPGERPAEQLIALLRGCGGTGDDRAHVLVESPGGRGKSALLREIVKVALADFQQSPRAPIPIMCVGEEGDLFTRAMRGLGSEAFSPELVATLMQSGHFFIVADGLTESTITPAHIQAHAAQFATRCPMLLAGRPNDRYRRAFQSTGAWVLVEPVRLDDVTLAGFIDAYGSSLDKFNEELRSACRNADGEYLPILVRLALFATGNRAASVSELYRGAVRHLLKQQDKLVDAAVALCLATYWIDGERRLVFANAPEARKSELRLLWDAGLLIPADASMIPGEEPRTLQFFHDSIQSYLTAVGLARREDRLQLLQRAAGDGVFARGESDLLTDGGSELFQMCLYVFEPTEAVREALRDQLLLFAQQYGGSLSRNWIVASANLRHLESLIPQQAAAGAALEVAVNEASAQADIQFIGRLYAKVVGTLWSELRAAPAGSSSPPSPSV